MLSSSLHGTATSTFCYLLFQIGVASGALQHAEVLGAVGHGEFVLPGGLLLLVVLRAVKDLG